ncbi:MAG TPA: subclass B3 metallo-beta-lactamase, partial [Polyangia bacterium]|nr:subclass B3 metallo-beta-lactamase [Polyangia bacterium]
MAAGRRVTVGAVLATVVGAGAGCAPALAPVPAELADMNQDVAPYQVIDNVYYVGGNGVAQFLVTTPAGHFLLDGGFDASVPRLRAEVASLGFRFDDIKYLLVSHAHIDHAQGDARVRALTGAKVVASARDGETLAAGGKGEAVYDGVYSWAPCPVDRVVADGERVSLGGTTLTAHLTPGHTRGAVTWTMQVAAPEARPGAPRLDVVFFPSASVNEGVRLVGNARYPEIVADFERSFATWKALPCDVFLGVHGAFYDMERKRARQLEGVTPNPFIDPGGYRRFVARAEGRFREQLASERVEVAVTVDDLPVHGPLPPGVDRAGLADRIIATLGRHGLRGVYGFVNGKSVADDPASEAVLWRWLAAGNRLGNHTYSHLDLNKATLGAYLDDVAKGEGVLARLVPGSASWKVFRYPFLFEGDTSEKRAAVRAYLRERGYATAEVTIDAGDWAFNRPFARCAAQGNAAALAELRRSFVSVHLDELARVRGVTRELVHREIRHVLLLHLGAAEADGLDDLLTAFERAGVSWIPLESALGDPFYRLDPEAPSPDGAALPYLLARARGLTVPPSPADALSGRLS